MATSGASGAQASKANTWHGKVVFAITALALVALLVVLALRITAATSSATRPVAHAGRPAPDVRLTAWNASNGAIGAQIDLATNKGHPVVLNFWASWCGPCHDEAPTLAAAARKFQPKGVRFIGVAEQTSASDGLAFLRQYGIPYPCGSDTSTGSAAVAYALPGIPVTVLIDRHGNVAQKLIGPLNAQQLDQSLTKLLS